MFTKILGYIFIICSISGMTALGLKACDHEAEQNEIKNRQWVQDVKDGKPYTNYGE